eukprot:TRINITY_DN3507_c0_g1_i2.p1 TRINITY_DN3507_c0_g1~~TRINITY_DN3507_c0_g1_i2.p1  ORF type:complete len:557 (-),score=84.96 TRINITY_DN3507_c0_g1_i2:14-1684(-)
MTSFGRPTPRAQYQASKGGRMYTELHETQSEVASQLLRCDKRKTRLQQALRHSRNKLAKNLVETKNRGGRRKPATHNHLGISLEGPSPEKNKKQSDVNIRSTAFVVDSFVNYQSMVSTASANAKLTKGGTDLDLSFGLSGTQSDRDGDGDKDEGTIKKMTAKEKAKAALIRRLKPSLRSLRTSILVARAVYRWKALVARRRVLKELEFREMFLPQEPVLQPAESENEYEFYPGLSSEGTSHVTPSTRQPSSPRGTLPPPSERTRGFDDGATVRSKYGQQSDRPRLARSYTSHMSHVSHSSKQGHESLYPQHQQRPPTSPRVPRPDIMKRLAIPSETQRAALEKRAADSELEEKILFERRNSLVSTLMGGLPAQAAVVPVNQVKRNIYKKADEMSPRKPRSARRRRGSAANSSAPSTPRRQSPSVQFKGETNEDAALVEESIATHARRSAGVRPQTAPTRHQVNVARVSAARRVAMADRSWNRKNRPPPPKARPRFRPSRQQLEGTQTLGVRPRSPPSSPQVPVKAHSTQNTPLKSAMKGTTPRAHHVRIVDDNDMA